MNIMEFLMQNYIWIIVIIVITIITIIGFLADKNRVNKKKEKTQQQVQNTGEQTVNNQGQMQYQTPVQNETNQTNNNLNNHSNNNNWGVNYNNMNTTINPINSNNQMNNNMDNNNTLNKVQTEPMMGNVPEPIREEVSGNLNTMNSPQPVENIARNVEQEHIYQPLSEQKPVLPSQPVPNYTSIPNPVPTEINQINNTPINVIPTPIENPNNFAGMTPSITQSQPNMTGPMMQQQMQPELPTYNNVQAPMTQVENNNFGMMPNFIPNNTTIPQPVNPIPTPQPVMTQPIMSQQTEQERYNQPQMMQPNFGQQMPQQTSNMTGGQPVEQTTAPQPVSFVYGPQNNQNM